MADISQINLPNGSSYNVKDASALHNITVPEYDPTSTYNVGDFVTYNGNIYMCIVAIGTPEAWNSNHWRLVDADQSYLHSLNPNGAGSFSLNRKDNTTIGDCSFAEGYINTASGAYSHAEGSNTTASGTNSHTEGYSTTAGGAYSHAEGYITTASSAYSHTEGYKTTANGNRSHAEGSNTTTSAIASHAEGDTTTSSGYASHAEGYYTTASHIASHAEGDRTTASGYASHAEGNYTTANHLAQHTFGEYNVLDTSTANATNRGNYIEIVGNGTADDARSNARTLDWSGNEVLAGRLKVNGTQDVPIIYEVTQSQYDTLKQAGTLVHNALYVITDAQNLNATASDIEYSSGVTVYDKINRMDTLDYYQVPNAVADNASAQIPAAVWGHRLIIINVRRYGYFGSMFVRKQNIVEGQLGASCCIYVSSSPKYFKVNETGLFTALQNFGTEGQWVDFIGIF